LGLHPKGKFLRISSIRGACTGGAGYNGEKTGNRCGRGKKGRDRAKGSRVELFGYRQEGI